jgi:hypothetical protein
MGGWAPATNIVVVHAWKIVVDERVCVNYLDGGGQTGGVSSSTCGPVRGEDEHSTNSFSSCLEGISNRLGDGGRDPV